MSATRCWPRAAAIWRRSSMWSGPRTPRATGPRASATAPCRRRRRRSTSRSGSIGWRRTGTGACRWRWSTTASTAAVAWASWSRPASREFPCQFQWQNYQAGQYAMGIEPSTNHVFGKPFAQERGEAIWLEHGEERSYTTRMAVLDGRDEIAAVEQRIRAHLRPAGHRLPRADRALGRPGLSHGVRGQDDPVHGRRRRPRYRECAELHARRCPGDLRRHRRGQDRGAGGPGAGGRAGQPRGRAIGPGRPCRPGARACGPGRARGPCRHRHQQRGDLSGQAVRGVHARRLPGSAARQCRGRGGLRARRSAGHATARLGPDRQHRQRHLLRRLGQSQPLRRLQGGTGRA